METLKTIVAYAGGIIAMIIAFHIFILIFMMLGIAMGSEQVVNTPYWDNLLRIILELL
jgi:uncharacterized protein (DUF983 family)